LACHYAILLISASRLGSRDGVSFVVALTLISELKSFVNSNNMQFICAWRQDPRLCNTLQSGGCGRRRSAFRTRLMSSFQFFFG